MNPENSSPKIPILFKIVDTSRGICVILESVLFPIILCLIIGGVFIFPPNVVIPIVKFPFFIWLGIFISGTVCTFIRNEQKPKISILKKVWRKPYEQGDEL